MSVRMNTSQRVLSALSAGFTAAGAALRSDIKRPSTAAEPEEWMREMFSPMTTAGVQVSEGTAMRLATHFACVNLISRTLGSFPIHVYERMSDGRKRKAIEHPVYRLLHDQPNPETTPMIFKETLQANLSNTGKAFAEIVWGRDGYPKELWPLESKQVQPRRRDDGDLEYLIDGIPVPGWKILHIPGLGFDGLNSFSPVGLFRQTIGLGLAAEEYGARFFGQGTNIGGFLELQNELSDDAYKRLKESMAEKYQGLQKSHGLVLLEGGAKYSKIGMSMEDAQFIETHKFNRSTIAMIHGVPPHLIGDLEKATFSNIEHQGIEAVMYLFRPWAVRWEEALAARLFTKKERGRFYIRFNLDALLRGDTKSRYDAYAIGRQWGWLSADDIRELEDEDPLPDGKGKTYLQPMNMVPAGVTPAVRTNIATRAGLSQRRALCDRETSTLCAALERKQEITPIACRLWVGLADIVRSEIGWLDFDGSTFISKYIDGLTQRSIGSAPAQVAGELHRMSNAFLRELYSRAGVKRLGLIPGRLCREALENRIVSIDIPFFEKGEVIHSGDLAITTEYRVWNPPVFVGDDSEIIPILED